MTGLRTPDLHGKLHGPFSIWRQLEQGHRKVVVTPKFRVRVFDRGSAELIEDLLDCAAGTGLAMPCTATFKRPHAASGARSAEVRNRLRTSARASSSRSTFLMKRACYRRSSAEDRARGRVTTADSSTAFQGRADSNVVSSEPRCESLRWI